MTGAQSFDVIADAGCEWRAQSTVPWITITAGGGSAGNGVVAYLVEPNGEGITRTGSIAVNAKAFTVNQTGNIVIDNVGDSGGDGGGDGGGGAGGASGGSSG